MSSAEWASWASLFWLVALGCYWLTFFLGNATRFFADPHPSQWGSHLSMLGKGLIGGIVFSIVAYLAVYLLGQVLPPWLIAVALFLAMLYYVFSFLSLALTALYLLPASWGVFGKQSKVVLRTTGRIARGTATVLDERNANAVLGAAPSRATVPPKLARQVIESIPTAYGWTEFWQWARARGIVDRQHIDRILGYSSASMTPAELRHRLGGILGDT